MKCPRCKSNNTKKWKDRWACKDCKYTWTKGKKNTYKGKIECPDCGSLKVRKHDKSMYTGKKDGSVMSVEHHGQKELT